eukprot:Tbor_TRINITY_DN7673_c0_g1::TRINITY_DN7673_c0_g1_i1::g.990::m.990
MTTFQQRLKEQQEEMMKYNQSPLTPSKYLDTANLKLPKKNYYYRSPYTRHTKENPNNNNNNNLVIPEHNSNNNNIADKKAAPRRLHSTVPEILPVSLIPSHSPNAMKDGKLISIDVHPVTRCPPSANSYMNNLYPTPIASHIPRQTLSSDMELDSGPDDRPEVTIGEGQYFYQSKVFQPLHVTETLELCLRVLRKNQKVGRVLSSRDCALIETIASYGRNTI